MAKGQASLFTLSRALNGKLPPTPRWSKSPCALGRKKVWCHREKGRAVPENSGALSARIVSLPAASPGRVFSLVNSLRSPVRAGQQRNPPSTCLPQARKACSKGGHGDSVNRVGSMLGVNVIQAQKVNIMDNATAKTATSATEVRATASIVDYFPDAVLEAAALEISVCSTTSPRPCNDC